MSVSLTAASWAAVTAVPAGADSPGEGRSARTSWRAQEQTGTPAPAGLQRWSVPPLGSRALEIDLVTGELHIEGWDQPGLEIDVVPIAGPSGRSGAPSATVEETDDAVVVSVTPPAGGSTGGDAARVTVRLPFAATIRRFSVSDGTATLAHLTGTVLGKVERGSLTARGVSGVLRLETDRGPLLVREAELTPGGLIRLRTFDGDIALDLVRRPSDARVLVLTMTGRIDSALPLEERSGFGRRFREGVFGLGEPLVSLDTVRGNVSLTVGGRP